MITTSIYKTPADEQTLCDIAKCYIEEWGRENVELHVPKRWLEYEERRNRLFIFDQSEPQIIISVPGGPRFVMELACV